VNRFALVLSTMRVLVRWPRAVALYSVAMMASEQPIDLGGDGGCTMTVLRAPLPSAASASTGLYATVNFRAILQNGTVLHDSWQQSEPLEVRVGQDPSDAVRTAPLPPVALTRDAATA